MRAQVSPLTSRANPLDEVYQLGLRLGGQGHIALLLREEPPRSRAFGPAECLLVAAADLTLAMGLRAPRQPP
jgi:hypothetical protein